MHAHSKSYQRHAIPHELTAQQECKCETSGPRPTLGCGYRTIPMIVLISRSLHLYRTCPACAVYGAWSCQNRKCYEPFFSPEVILENFKHRMADSKVRAHSKVLCYSHKFAGLPAIYNFHFQTGPWASIVTSTGYIIHNKVLPNQNKHTSSSYKLHTSA